MKTTLTSVLMLLCLQAFTQNCPDFDRLMKEGDAAKDYEVAFNKYDAADAVACSEADRNKARRKKSELFRKINLLREKAEAAEADAKRSARLAEEATQKIKEEQEKTLAERNRALEALRLNKLMSDSVAQATSQVQVANESVSSLIRMNDLEELGNIALKKEDYAAALKHFNGALQMIEEMTGQDTSLSTKAELIRSRIDLLKEQWAKVQLVESLLSEGDSLKNLGAKNLSDAFDRYLTAGTFDLKRERVLAGLDAAEGQLQSNWKAAKRLPQHQYLDLLINSTKAFDYSGNQIDYRQRINTISRLPDLDLTQIQDDQIRAVASNYRRSFWRRVSVFAGMRYRFGSQSNKPIMTATLRKNVSISIYSDRSVSVPVEKLKADLEPNFDFSVNYKVSDIISIGAGLNLRKSTYRAYYGSSTTVSGYWEVNDTDSTFYSGLNGGLPLSRIWANLSETQTNFHLNFYFDLLKLLKKRGPFGIQFVAGLESNSNTDISASFNFETYQARQSTLYFSYETPASESVKLYVYVPPYVDEHFSNLSFNINDFAYNTNTTRELEVLMGMRVTIEPFRTFRKIGLFSEISYRHSIPGILKPRKHFNLADLAIKEFPNSEFINYPQEEIDLFFADVKKIYDVDISLDARRRQLLYAWNLNAGIYYRF
ncbi:MAG: hypothetical protein JNJ57_08415 [Saprospiraceae bacterium]|nr:hypothetical protein [Saprospiraceae bacterium]